MRTIIIGSILILAAAMFRLLPHPANVTPLAAMALAGGVYLDRRFALIIPLVAMAVSDLLLGFHATIPFVYASFLLIGVVGLWLRSHKTIAMTAGATVAGSVVFFLITNFGVWMTGGGWGYPMTLDGLMACYAVAIPFFRNTIIGDVVGVTVLFGLFEIAERWLGARAVAARA